MIFVRECVRVFVCLRICWKVHLHRDAQAEFASRAIQAIHSPPNLLEVNIVNLNYEIKS